jgi:hypothetical protein
MRTLSLIISEKSLYGIAALESESKIMDECLSEALESLRDEKDRGVVRLSRSQCAVLLTYSSFVRAKMRTKTLAAFDTALEEFRSEVSRLISQKNPSQKIENAALVIYQKAERGVF